MALMNVIYKLFDLLLSPLDVPCMPDEFLTAVDTFIGYFDYAENLIGFFVPINLEIFFTVWFAIFAVHHAYPLIMWILRKIPMLGIE